MISRIAGTATATILIYFSIERSIWNIPELFRHIGLICRALLLRLKIAFFSLSLSREASVFFADFLQDFNDAFKDFNDLFHVGVFGFDFCGVELHLVMCLCEVRRNGGLGNISGK